MIDPHRPRRAAPLLARRLWLARGIAAAMFYVTVVVFWWSPPVRLLYDGYAPPAPYRWVHPPAARAKDNESALSGTGTVPLGPLGSLPRVIGTDDAQAAVTIPEGAIVPRPGQTAARITIVPLAPAGLPPAGYDFDGNAYRIEAYYVPSAKNVVLAQHLTVVLSYPIHATTMLRSTGDGWTVLPTIRYQASLQILANSDRFGIFMPAASRTSRVWAWIPYVAVGVGLGAVIVVFLLIRRAGGEP